MMFLGYKIVSLTKCKNVKLTLLVIMMNMVLFSDLVGQLILSSIIQKDIDDMFYEQNTKSGEFIMFEFFNAFVRDLTFEIMIFINLNNWITYAITIEE